MKTKKIVICFLLILEFCSCLTIKNNIQIEKQISNKFFIGTTNNSSEIGLYQLNVLINNENNPSDSSVYYNEYYSSSIKEYFFQDGYVLFKRKRNKKMEYKIFFIRNDSLLKQYTFKNHSLFVSKCKTLNIANPLDW